LSESELNESSEAPVDRRRLAVVAFFGHVFGLWLVGHRPGPAKTPVNRWAIMATAVTMSAGAFIDGGRGVLIGWLIGHFAWSGYLALAVLRGDAGFPREVKATWE
jgi:hypothetical protein